MKTIGLSLVTLFIFFSPLLRAQEFPLQKREAVIHYTPIAEGFQFSATTPPLGQIAGAPPAFYGFYWEFGDGHFSFKENPVYIYDEPGQYDLRLWLTNNYDDGKPPPTKPKSFYANESMLASLQPTELLPVIKDDASLRLQTNHSPSPEQEMVCIFTYKNKLDKIAGGTLYLFFNERNYKYPMFEFSEERTHYGETQVVEQTALSYTETPMPPQDYLVSLDDNPALGSSSRGLLVEAIQDLNLAQALDDANASYGNKVAWKFNGLTPGTERNLFTTLTATPQMLADTNAIISLKAFYVPDGAPDFEEFTLELEIVASHDPNHIAVSDTRVNFRRAKRRELTYKVRFQNTGKGPAGRIEITNNVPKGFDIGKTEILGYYPSCPICPEEEVSFSCLDTLLEEEQIRFIFNNIYLPGLRQEGVSDRDSTQGFISYRISPRKRIKKFDLNCQAKIVFDKNPPIKTNSASTHFTGSSLGIKAGVYLATNDFSQKRYFMGATYSPFKSYRLFYQPEIAIGYGTGASCSQFIELIDPPQTFIGFLHNIDSTFYFVDIIPLQIRKNFNSFISAGIGGQLSFIFGEEVQTFRETQEDHPECGQLDPTHPPIQGTQNFSALSPAVFADINVGRVRNGPALGLRYLYALKKNDANYLQLFANWKF